MIQHRTTNTTTSLAFATITLLGALADPGSATPDCPGPYVGLVAAATGYKPTDETERLSIAGLVAGATGYAHPTTPAGCS